MKVIALLILSIAISSCTASVDTTLIGILTNAVKKDVDAKMIEKSRGEADHENMANEAEQIVFEDSEFEYEEIFSDLRKLSESRSQIEEPQLTSTKGELIDLRDSHAEKMSEKIRESGLEQMKNSSQEDEF